MQGWSQSSQNSFKWDSESPNLSCTFTFNSFTERESRLNDWVDGAGQYVLSKQPSCPQSTWNNEHIVLRADVNLLNLKSLTLQSICDLLTFIFTGIYPENGPLGEGLVRPPSIEKSFWDFGKPNCPNYSNHQHVFLAFNASVMTKELAGWLFRMCMMKVNIMNRISAVLFGNWGQGMVLDLHP